MDFSGLIPVNDTIQALGAEIHVDSGVEWDIGSMLSGNTLLDGTTVMHIVTGGVEGNIYRLVYFLQTTSGVLKQLSGYLVIMPDPFGTDQTLNPRIAESLPDPIDTPYGGLN